MSREEAIRIVQAALEEYVDDCLSGPEYDDEVQELSRAWTVVLETPPKG